MTGIRTHDRVFVALLLLLVALTWLALGLWERSPYEEWLAHGGHAAHRHGAGAAGSLLAVHAAGWVLMTAAMMLPTTLPLLATFRRLSERRADRGRLTALVVGGYLVVWGLFGVAAHAGVRLLEGVSGGAWLAPGGAGFAAAVIAVAGLFQFSALKYRCLDACRSPLGFVLGYWRRGQGAWGAFRLGMEHGRYCVGCCWALMLLMFVAGLGNVAWMLVLGALMAIEKNVVWGRRMTAPLGGVLLAWAGLVALGVVWPG